MNDLNVLVDTNVILDFFLSRSPQEEVAKKIFELAYRDEIAAYTTASSITDIYYILAKRLGNGTAREVLRNLFNLVSIITVDENDCFSALNLPMSDFEDALVCTCAKKEGVDYIVSNDAGFLKAESATAKVVGAEEFLRLL